MENKNNQVKMEKVDEKAHPSMLKKLQIPAPAASGEPGGSRRGSVRSTGGSRRGSTVQDIQRYKELVARYQEKKQAYEKQIRKELRIMLLTSCIAVIGACLWIFSIGTDHWYAVAVNIDEVTEGEVEGSGDGASAGGDASSNYTEKLGKFFLSSNTGLIRECRTIRKISSPQNFVDETWCKYHTFFTSKEDLNTDPDMEHIIDYRRTMASMGVVSVVLMVLALLSAFYVFKNSRYMFKRLASGLYFLTASTVLIVLNVSTYSLNFEIENVPSKHPKNSTSSHGYSFYIGWAVFVIYIVSSIVYIVCSRKRKGDKAFGKGKDDGMVIGR